MADTIKIRPISGFVGAEIHGVDLNVLEPRELVKLRAAFIEHQVLFFPDQRLTADAFYRFATHWGEVEPLKPGMPTAQHPNVLLVESKDGGGPGKFNDIWHSDLSFHRFPPSVTALQAVTVPPQGGDTVFAGMYAAYDSLSAPLRALVDDLETVHDGLPSFTTYLMDPSVHDGKGRLNRLRSTNTVSTHPMVRRHPESGRKSLYINRTFTTRVLGLSEIESRNLLNLLLEHAEQPSFQMRWRWREGDVGLWDNRCVLHYAAKDYGRAHRVMRRITLKGDKPFA